VWVKQHAAQHAQPETGLHQHALLQLHNIKHHTSWNVPLRCPVLPQCKILQHTTSTPVRIVLQPDAAAIQTHSSASTQQLCT
jgi:hypothetical protein